MLSLLTLYTLSYVCTIFTDKQEQCKTLFSTAPGLRAIIIDKLLPSIAMDVFRYL